MRILTAVSVVFLLGCTGEKAGDPCDKFFQNTCKAPLSCVDVGDKKVCAGSCDTEMSPDEKAPDGRMIAAGKPMKVCKDKSMVPSEVTYSKGTENVGSAGCHCLPKK